MVTAVFLGYVLAFSLAAVACFASVYRTSQIRADDVRVGLAALLATSGGWASAHVGYLLVPSPPAKLAFYVLGLVVGFAAIGAWLYFCSAYTGRTYHRQRTYRSLAIAAFAVVVLLKVTNPIHSLYFTAEVVSTPFYHLAVSHRLIHWVVMALAYALSFVGFFMLFERFVSVGLDTTALVILVGTTALPVAFDILGIVTPALVSMTYEPIGVAVFAVGVLFVYHDRFQAVTMAAGTDVPVIFLDAEDRIRDYNQQARTLFPALSESHGEMLSTVSETLAEALSTEGRVIEESSATGTRYYLASATPFGVGAASTGHLLTLTEVTETEQYRRELERKTNKLEQFASVVSHDLRNPLSVAQGYVELARANPESPEDDLREVVKAHARMEALIDDLLALAREGQAIEAPEPIGLSALLERCWRNVKTGNATLVCEADATILADPDRLQQLFENLFRNAIEHGGSAVTITVGELDGGFYVEDDGPGIPADERDGVFEFGYSTSESGTGFGLAIVEEIVDGHGWTIEIADGERGGARFEIRNVERAR